MHPHARARSPKLVLWNKFQLHRTVMSLDGSSIHAELCPQNRDVQYVVVASLGEVPDPEKGHCTKSFLVPANLSGQWWPVHLQNTINQHSLLLVTYNLDVTYMKSERI